jgi:phenylpropionate dioxygenase-like ring-hydroxylating dioxygenase large terminal subunit
MNNIEKTSMNLPYPKINIDRWFSQEVHEEELKHLFNAPNLLKYSGHELIVPNNNDYWVPPQLDNRWIVVNKDGKTELVSNVCLHRQAPIVEGKGNSAFFTCKVHCWNYNNKGKLRSAPLFNDVDGELEKKELYNWNGLLLQGGVPGFTLKDAGVDDIVDFSKYHYAFTDTLEQDYNWKSFSEIYLENYHIFAIHPGFNGFVDCNNQSWFMHESGSVQRVGMKETLDTIAGSKCFEDYQKLLLKAFEGRMPRLGAVWIYLYPNIMIDWYPGVIVVSTIHPVSPQKCVNLVDYFFETEIYEKCPEFFEASKVMYDEVAVEDSFASGYQDKGRRALYLNGETLSGPMELNQEIGVKGLYEWIRKTHPRQSEQ